MIVRRKVVMDPAPSCGILSVEDMRCKISSRCAGLDDPTNRPGTVVTRVPLAVFYFNSKLRLTLVRCFVISINSNRMMRILVLLMWTATAAAVPLLLRGGTSRAIQVMIWSQYWYCILQSSSWFEVAVRISKTMPRLDHGARV